MQKDIRRLKSAVQTDAATDDDSEGDDRMETEEAEAGQRQRAQHIDLDNATLFIVCFPSLLGIPT